MENYVGDALTLGGLDRFQSLVFLVVPLLFIAALAGLSRQKSAVMGNMAGVAGMVIALVAVIGKAVALSASPRVVTGVLILLALAVGALVGSFKALRVKMTGMPELVAMLHSFVGACAVLVGLGSFLAAPGDGTYENAFHMGEVGLAVFIGAVTLTGSVVAYLKLAAKINGKPLMLPCRNVINAVLVAACVAGIGWFVNTQGISNGLPPLLLVALLSLVLGAHLVLAIGGGDMPVVVSMLNSYSGWAAAMAGFTLGNDLLIIAGALVGSSGAYLSYVMCQGMNRSLASVILGGLGSEGGGSKMREAHDYGAHTEVGPEEVATMLRDAERAVIVPGYGMAVAQAQFPVAELTRRLIDQGVDVRFAVHPVAGRMPGHMNVLLAEAKVPYESVLEMDEINDELDEVDVVLVVGANDTVNPAAETEPDSPIAGMPVLRVWEAGKVIVSKRSMGNAGYAGVQNPLFYRENTDMLLGDAKQTMEAVLAAL